ncbi:ankyrin repeat-containing protein [Beggiatoa alba B18LD]|uniref:Ankyrin repeat-containing protein n=1 Tax=Beggiatoa alba B18LD TaxID=395493 RepID=I3CBF3_9GAMM|nr:ankyrin repeat domain-containing protein [Beggiatoa alba]EIJ40946.1 ankyrin repeat-containing protein [Beggiatoa alba B18LD]
MSFLKKIRNLVTQNSNEIAVTEAVHAFSPEALDSPPNYVFINALHAAKQGDLAKIQSYLQFNKNYVFCRNWEDRTLLHDAVSTARVEVVKYLLEQGADANAICKEQTPLHFAIEGDVREMANKTPEQFLEYRKRRREVIRLLLNHHADFNIANENGEFPLHVAAKLGLFELIDVLLSAGDDVNKLTAPPEQTDEKTVINAARPPLLLACKYSKELKTIQLLLNKGANPNVTDQEPGYNALHYLVAYRAAKQEKEVKESRLRDVALLLIKAGIDVNALTNDVEAQTALHLAVNNDYFSLVELLVQHGANLELKNAKGLMPLGIAARNGDARMAEYLLKKGAGARRSRVLFHAASCTKNDTVLRMLLDQGMDVNLPDEEGYTPIFAAIAAYSLHNVKLLMEKGVDLTQRSPKGQTVLELAFACWGEVSNLTGETVSQERKQAESDAKEIIRLLGGFERPEKRLFV